MVAAHDQKTTLFDDIVLVNHFLTDTDETAEPVSVLAAVHTRRRCGSDAGALLATMAMVLPVDCGHTAQDIAQLADREHCGMKTKRACSWAWMIRAEATLKARVKI